MANRQNIQVLFDTLIPEQVSTYLESRDWKIVETNEDEFQVFETSHEEGMRRVQFLKSKAHSSFRSRLQNLVFTLAVMYGEEPLDICNAMYDLQPPTTFDKGASKQETPLVKKEVCLSRITICNRFDDSIEVQCDSLWNAGISIESGEELELVFNPSHSNTPRIDYFERRIQVALPDPGQARIFQKQALQGGTAGIRETVRLGMEGFPERNGVAGMFEELEPAISRAEFELQDVSLGSDRNRILLKPLAMLLASLAGRLPCEELSTKLVWQVCSSVLAAHDTLVEIYPNVRKELFSLAKEDSENAPQLTLDWLTTHVWGGGELN